MDEQTAIEMLKNLYVKSTRMVGGRLKGGQINHGQPENEAIDTAIQALAKQAFFENEVSNIRDWFVDNKDCLLDSAMNVAHKKFKEVDIENNGNEFTRIDLDFIVEDIVDTIQEGILNVLSTFMKEYKEELNEV